MCAVTKEFVITTSHLIIDENDISDWNKELHKTRSTFERSDCDVWRKGLVRSLCSNSSQKCSLQRILCMQVKFFHSKLPRPCLYGPCFLWWVGRGHPQTLSTKLGAWNSPKCLSMLKQHALHHCVHCSDVRLGCSYSGMETHSMKLSTAVLLSFPVTSTLIYNSTNSWMWNI